MALMLVTATKVDLAVDDTSVGLGPCWDNGSVSEHWRKEAFEDSGSILRAPSDRPGDQSSVLVTYSPKSVTSYVGTVRAYRQERERIRIVSVNSFLDTRGSKIMRHQPKSIVAHVLPGQGLYSHAVQSARSHYIDAGTHAAPSGVLPRYQRL